MTEISQNVSDTTKSEINAASLNTTPTPSELVVTPIQWLSPQVLQHSPENYC